MAAVHTPVSLAKLQRTEAKSLIMESYNNEKGAYLMAGNTQSLSAGWYETTHSRKLERKKKSSFWVKKQILCKKWDT